jgi:hypothetical protein
VTIIAATPANAARLFRSGMDTFEIAQHFEMHEAEVLEMVTRQREADRGLSPSYGGKMPLFLVPFTDRHGNLHRSE